MRWLHRWRAAGEPWIWLSAGAVALSLLIVFGLVGLLAARGLGHFWPDTLWRLTVVADDGERTELLGAVVDTESVSRARHLEARGGRPDPRLPAAALRVERSLVRTGNRDLAPPEFVWLDDHRIVGRTRPRDAVALERRSWGDAYGFLSAVDDGAEGVVTGPDAWPLLEQRLARADALRARIEALRDGEIAELAARLERQRRDGVDAGSPARAETLEAWADAERRLRLLEAALGEDALTLTLVDGRAVRIAVADVLDAWRPNAMGTLQRMAFQLRRIGAFLTEDPREANTEGGIFPAIFGTVLMVLLMAILVTPLGVVAALYLHEYARQGPLVRTLRIAVHNLAGVPSIVYGVFGLGFFVYVLGGSIDELLFSDTLPAPTFGTPGLLWAALTLALLTVPVVIVSTEEGLSRIPSELRDGAYALGATRAETLRRVILPMASPSILTGVILAVARAAGEVAPLMLVGVVKLAPRLPVDGDFPFLHLERKFMHLGFHVYDVGFQSPNVEAARPLVFATALLLVIIIVVLNLAAIVLRGRLDRRYRAFDL